MLARCGIFPDCARDISRVVEAFRLREISRMIAPANERSELAIRIESEILRLGLNDHSLARMAGLQQDAIRDLLRGKKKGLRADRLAAIARALGRESDELTGDAPMRDPGELSAHEERQPDLVNDGDELALLTLWRTLNDDEREFMLAIVREAVRFSRKSA